MGVSIQSQKQKAQEASGKLKDMLTPPKGKGSLLSKAEQAEVDEFAQLNEEIAAMAKKLKRHDELKKSLAEIATDRFDKSTAAVLKGQLAEVEFTANGSKREVSDMQNLVGCLREKIGYDKLITLVKVTLGDVDTYLTANESKQFIDADPVGGSRKLAAVRFTK